ncbi:MAG: peptidoglycan binding domain-containing protein [Undibacterium sp.]
MLYRSTRYDRLFSRAALIAALVFLLPQASQAFAIPEEITLETSTFAQIMNRDEILSWYTATKRLVINPARSAEFEQTDSACVPYALFCDAFMSRATKSHIVLSQSLTLNTEALKQSIGSFAEKADRDPKNARFRVEDSKVLIATPAENGIIVNPDESLKALESALLSAKTKQLTIDLVSENVPAHVSGETLASLGITELIGTATTNFRGSPKNRIYNIERAVQQFDGIVIEPGAL